MSDLPADTLTTTIAEVIDEWWATSEQPTIVHDGVTYIASLDLAAAVVSVLATHNQHAAADALRDAADAAVPKFNVHPLNRSNTVRDWLIARADRLAAVSPTPPTHTCTTPGCPGDYRYAAPGRHHIEGCTYPAPVPPTHTTTTEDQP